MFGYQLMFFLISGIIWNIPVIVGSIVGFSRASKGKSPVGAFLVGILILLIPVLGEYLGNVREHTGYLFSEDVVLAIIFGVIYVGITLPLAIRKYHKYTNEMVYYCVSCDDTFDGDVRDEPPAHFKCPKCGTPLANTSVLWAEWGKLTSDGKNEVLQQFVPPKNFEPVEAKPVETEPVEAKPVETEPVEAKPVETEPVEAKPVKTEPESSLVHPVRFSSADEILKYKELMDDGIITQEEFDAKKKQLLGL